ncbi:MAG: hypothetical protein ACE5IQ_13275 [Candidatus Methylomirabilales bacterium]
MRSLKIIIGLIGAALLVGGARAALAHITPPVVLLSDRAAVVGMMPGARRFFVREVRLTPRERALIEKDWGWKPEQDRYRFYLGRDRQGHLVSAVTFVTEITMHGPVRVAVGIGPDGRIRDAKVVELTEETYYWLKPVLDQGLTQAYAGRDSRASFALAERFSEARLHSMPHLYAQIVASLIQRGVVLFEVTFVKRGHTS